MPLPYPVLHSVSTFHVAGITPCSKYQANCSSLVKYSTLYQCA